MFIASPNSFSPKEFPFAVVISLSSDMILHGRFWRLSFGVFFAGGGGGGGGAVIESPGDFFGLF